MKRQLKLITPTIFMVCFFIFLSIDILKAQTNNIGFEVIIADDSLEITDHYFIKMNDGLGYIGLIDKHKHNSSNFFSEQSVYRISLFGDTSSKVFSKPDTNIIYQYLLPITHEPEGYLITGIAFPVEKNGTNLAIFTRLDNDLNIVWERIIKIDSSIYVGGFQMCALEETNGNILYACSPNGWGKLFYLRLNSLGDSLQYRYYDGTEFKTGDAARLTYNHDSSIILRHSYFGHYIDGSPLVSCCTVDEGLNENQVWYYPANSNYPWHTKLYPDGGFMFCTTEIISYPGNNYDSYITAYRLDSNFQVLYKTRMTDADTNSRAATNNGIDYYYPDNIYVGGTFNFQSFTGNSPDWYYIARLNQNLELQSEKYIGGDDYYSLHSIVATQDGGVLLSGFRMPVGNDWHPYEYILKLDSMGYYVRTPETEEIQVKDVLLYPNPGKDRLKVRTALKDCIIHLFDMNGKLVLTAQLSEHINTLDVSGLPAGNYSYQVIQKQKTIENGKWIKSVN